MPDNSLSDRDDLQICWSCWSEFADGAGISIDESGEEQVCHRCWEAIPVTSRLVLGLLFRRLNQGGAGIKDLIEEALRVYPFGQGPRGSRN